MANIMSEAASDSARLCGWVPGEAVEIDASAMTPSGAGNERLSEGSFPLLPRSTDGNPGPLGNRPARIPVRTSPDPPVAITWVSSIDSTKPVRKVRHARIGALSLQHEMQSVLLREIARQGYSIRLKITGRSTPTIAQNSHPGEALEQELVSDHSNAPAEPTRGVQFHRRQHNQRRRLFYRTPNKSHSLTPAIQSPIATTSFLSRIASHAAIVSLHGNTA